MKRLYLLVSVIMIVVVLAGCTPAGVDESIVADLEAQLAEAQEALESAVDEADIKALEAELAEAQAALDEAMEVEEEAAPVVVELKELRVGIANEPWDLDPAIRSDTASGYIIENVYDPLIELDVNREVTTEYSLTESFEWNADKTVITLNLRKGVTFHDGTDFDAYDVVYNFEWILDDANNAPQKPRLGPVESVRAVDEHTFEVTFTDPFPDAPMLWAGTVMNGVVPEGGHGERSEEEGVSGELMSELSLNPIGTGPFKFVEWVSGSHITLEKFDDYWAEGVPAVDRVVFEIIPDDGAKLAALVSGSVHIIDYVPFRDYATIEYLDGIETRAMSGNLSQIVYLNQGRPPFGVGPDQVDDEAAREKAFNARKFLYHAIDREQILDRLFYGRGQIQTSIWYPDSDWSSPVLAEQPTYDPVLAQEYLDKSYPGGFSFQMMCNTAQWFCDVATIIQEQLRPYGVEVEIIAVDKATFFDTLYTTFEWDAGMEDWAQSTPLVYDFLNRSYVNNAKNHNHWHHEADDLPDGYHVTYPGHKEFADLWAQGNVEPDTQQRKEIAWELQEIATGAVIRVDLMWLDNLFAWRTSAVGYSDGVTPQANINLRYITELTED